MATSSSSTPGVSPSGLALSGLASGIDTSSIISQLMMIERVPQDRLKVQQVTENARQQALRDVQTKLQAVQQASSALADVGAWANVQTVDVNDSTKVAATYVSGSGPGAYQVAVSTLARAEQHWYTYTPPASADTITVGGHTINVTAGQDINSLANTINADGASPVYATAVTDSSTGSQYLVFASRSTGTTSAFSATGGSLVEDASKAVSGLDASYSVNGVAHTSHSNVVTDGIPGLSLTLKGTTTASGPVTVTVGAPAPNTITISDNIKNFVNAYNDAITFIQGKLAETKVRNPTTASDASQGVLHADSGLQSLLTSLRNSISGTYGNGGSTMDQLQELGVSTGAAVGSGALNQDSIAGKLTFDTAAFTTAITKSPNAVRDMLSGNVSGTGFSQAFSALLTPTVQAGGILDQRIAAENKVKSDLAAHIAAMDVTLQQKQALLSKQFTAMETAMSNSQAQGQWLSGQLAGLTPTH